jgi:hypothetical protein
VLAAIVLVLLGEAAPPHGDTRAVQDGDAAVLRGPASHPERVS